MKKSYWKRQTGWAKPFIQSPSRSRIEPNQRWETMSYSRCPAFSWARWQGPGTNPGTQCAMGPFQQAPLLQAQMPQKLRTFLSILTHTSSLASTITNICPLNKTTTITIVLLLVMFLLFCWFKHHFYQKQMFMSAMDLVGFRHFRSYVIGPKPGEECTPAHVIPLRGVCTRMCSFCTKASLPLALMAVPPACCVSLVSLASWSWEHVCVEDLSSSGLWVKLASVHVYVLLWNGELFWESVVFILFFLGRRIPDIEGNDCSLF